MDEAGLPVVGSLAPRVRFKQIVTGEIGGDDVGKVEIDDTKHSTVPCVTLAMLPTAFAYNTAHVLLEVQPRGAS
jgi:hypothetical protein